MKNFLILLAVCLSTLSHARLELPSYSQAAVKIFNQQNKKTGEGFSCSGFVAKPGFVVTAAHCLEPAGQLYVKFSLEWEPATVAFRGQSNSGTDFAILRVETKNIKPLELSDKDAFQETGAILTCRTKFQKAVPVGLAIIRDGELLLIADVIVGDSGAPVLGADGKVKGTIIGWREDGAEKIGRAVPGRIIKLALDAIK